MNENELENLILNWFQDVGWSYIPGTNIANDGQTPEREDYGQVLLNGRILKALHRLNPEVPAPILEEVLNRLAKPEHPSLIQNNHSFHKILLEGFPVVYEKDGEKRGDRVRLIDFEHREMNQFLVVNQFTVQGLKQLRRPDIVAFINGFPIAVIELKNPTVEQADIWAAYHQLQTYKNEISDLFMFNEAMIISDGFNARVGSLTASKEWFMPWRTIREEQDKPLLEYELEKIVRGFFDPDMLLDYLRYFILFEPTGDTFVKKIAGYHQFHAVREAVYTTIRAAGLSTNTEENGTLGEYTNKVEPGSKRGGIVWHTQGSGKSISMACFAGKLMQQSEMQNPTLVVVTDRNDLNGQLYQTFVNAKMLLKETPVKAENRDELRELLAGRPSGGIIFTTIQKFMPRKGENHYPKLTNRNNVVVIVDEAHRSQYGFQAKLDADVGAFKYGYAHHMRSALPSATFVGFTGTPIENDDKDTRKVFGSYVSIYDIQDAVMDGATVPIYYESRLAKLDIKQADIDILNEEVEEVLEDEEDLALREKSKSHWAALEQLVGADKRIKEVAKDLTMHFDNRNASIEGKGMIVCMSREICVNMYNAITELKPQWHREDPHNGTIKIIMTGSASDDELLQPHIYNSQTKKMLEKRFKDPNDPLKIVIVRDMWLTGFDVPCLHTMYVDKPMRAHNLMQAIARVNRVFHEKQGGLVVDYIGIASELRLALKTYVENRGKGTPTIDASEPLGILKEEMEKARDMFHGFNYDDYQDDAAELLLPAANHILGLENGRKRYFDVIVAISKAYSLCGTSDDAMKIREEIAFFQAVKVVISKASNSDKKIADEKKNQIIKQILDNALLSEGIEDIFKLAGLEKPDISILSDTFLDEIRHLPQKNLAVELLQKLLRDQIKSRVHNNVVQEHKFSERLTASLNRYHGHTIKSAEIIDELIAMAKEFRETAKRGDELGLNDSELAFYDALANNESAVHELGDETLKIIALELTEKLRKSTTVDWQKRDSVRAKLRNLVRITLRRYKYPPDKQKEAIKLVLQQAERLSDDWSKDVEN
ncbi:type I restriction endonuclease subunit R [Methanococcoides orientis]|nr:type I restriction endonuclease subunit R [Methanococcoides orientis]